MDFTATQQKLRFAKTDCEKLASFGPVMSVIARTGANALVKPTQRNPIIYLYVAAVSYIVHFLIALLAVAVDYGGVMHNSASVCVADSTAVMGYTVVYAIEVLWVLSAIVGYVVAWALLRSYHQDGYGIRNELVWMSIIGSIAFVLFVLGGIKAIRGYENGASFSFIDLGISLSALCIFGTQPSPLALWNNSCSSSCNIFTCCGFCFLLFEICSVSFLPPVSQVGAQRSHCCVVLVAHRSLRHSQKLLHRNTSRVPVNVSVKIRCPAP